jgi:hypothetical protein
MRAGNQKIMTPEERGEFRRKLGAAVLAIQDQYRDREPIVFIPELIAALMSLAVCVAKNNAGMSSFKFALAAETARAEAWPDNPTREEEGNKT